MTWLAAGRGDPCGRPHTGICPKDMPRGHVSRRQPPCVAAGDPVSWNILLSKSSYPPVGPLFLRQVVSRQVVFFNKHGRLRRRRASKARNTCPPSPSYTCSPPSGTAYVLILSAGYARPEGLAHPRLSIVGYIALARQSSSELGLHSLTRDVGPLRGPMYAHRAGDHKGRPYRRRHDATRAVAPTVTDTVAGTTQPARLPARRNPHGCPHSGPITTQPRTVAGRR